MLSTFPIRLVLRAIAFHMPQLSTRPTLHLSRPKSLCLQCNQSSAAVSMDFALFLQQSCTQLIEIDIRLLFQVDNEISVVVCETVEDNGKFDVRFNRRSDGCQL